ncbi:hypothetical protein ACFQ2A_21755 [Variovorax dokdonensis]
MTAAYKPYRIALFRTNSKSQVESEVAIVQAAQAWRDLVLKFSKNPPPPYDRDADFGKALTDVDAVYARATAEINEQKLTEAHETLEKVRDLLAEIRRRNNVIVYSDHMNAYHAEMEQLLTQGPKWASQTQGFYLLMEKLGSMEYLAARLRSEAPPEVTSDAAFAPAMKLVEQSLAGLREAVLAQDATRVREALSKVKGPYSQLFLKFG